MAVSATTNIALTSFSTARDRFERIIIVIILPTTQLSDQTPITILYESDRILAIYKPEGISHHDDHIEGSGIMSLVRKKQLAGEISYQGRIYGIHRLDRVTSGILLFAKDSTTAQLVTNLFRKGNVTKYYIGLSSKKPTKKKQGIVQGNMIPSRNKGWMLTRGDTTHRKRNNSNFAKTRFYTCGISYLDEHLRSISSNASTVTSIIQPSPKTLILFRPYTGKTHQIRVAAKSIGLPLYGDPIYKDGSTTNNTDAVQKSTRAIVTQPHRTYLHACAIHFSIDTNNYLTTTTNSTASNIENVTIFSIPPSTFGLNVYTELGVELLHRRIYDLVQQHCCDCSSILEAMYNSYNNNDK